MRKILIFIAAVLLVIAVGLQSGAQQMDPGNNPQYRPNDPRFQRNTPPMRGDRRSFVGQLSDDLIRQADLLAQASFQYFMGWNGMITDQEQAVLFKTEEFAAAARLFNRLAQDQTDYFRREGLRTNLFTASRYLSLSFHQLEEQMRLGGIQNDFDRTRRDGRPFQWQPQRGIAGPWGLVEMRRILDRIELEFSNWR